MITYVHIYDMLGGDKVVTVRIYEDEEGLCSFRGKVKDATNDFTSFVILEMLEKVKELVGREVTFELVKSEPIEE